MTETTSNSKREYEVGYKKPPKEGQFKKGQSGNPRGRPKGTQVGEAPDFEAMLIEAGKKSAYRLSKTELRAESVSGMRRSCSSSTKAQVVTYQA